MDFQEALIGKTIRSIAVSDGERVLRIATTSGPIYFMTEGDCCSESWWADILGVQAAIGSVVRSVDVNEEGSNIDDGRTRQEVDVVYGYTIHTTKGSLQLVFRNSSNGCYGGWCDATTEAPAVKRWTNITDDWSA